MGMTDKLFKCPLCGNKKYIMTNHDTELHRPCLKCGGFLHYCQDPETLKKLESLERVGVILHHYRYMTSESKDRKGYRIFRREMHERGYVISTIIQKEFPSPFEYIRSLTGMFGTLEIELYAPRIEAVCYSSTIGLVYNWAEAQGQNPDLREGYWLELVGESDEQIL